MLLMICSVCAFSACSDDDDEKKEGEQEKVCPVKNIEVPATAEAEGMVTITGNGFATTAKLALQKEEETPMEVEADITSDEVTFKVPANFLGEYDVILTQDGEWNIGTITITPAARGLRVKQVIATSWSEYAFTFTYDEQNRVSNITQITDGMSDYAWSYDFAYEENCIDVAVTYNDPNGADKGNFSFKLSDGRIVGTLDEDGDESLWEYDENNYLSAGGYEECEFTWENNNLTRLYSGYSFVGGTAVYGDSKSNNAPIDIVPLMYNYFSQVLENDMHDILAYMLDICGNHSANLPTEMTDDAGEMKTINYEWDAEHPEYMSKASMPTDWDPYSIEIIYE